MAETTQHNLLSEIKWEEEEPRELVLKPINKK